METWNFLHQPPGAPLPLPLATNVMPDLAIAMKYNPDLKVLLNAGYFDLATPFYEGVYEMQHLPIRLACRAISNSNSTSQGTWSTRIKLR